MVRFVNRWVEISTSTSLFLKQELTNIKTNNPKFSNISFRKSDDYCLEERQYNAPLHRKANLTQLQKRTITLSHRKDLRQSKLFEYLLHSGIGHGV